MASHGTLPGNTYLSSGNGPTYTNTPLTNVIPTVGLTPGNVVTLRPPGTNKPDTTPTAPDKATQNMKLLFLVALGLVAVYILKK